MEPRVNASNPWKYLSATAIAPRSAAVISVNLMSTAQLLNVEGITFGSPTATIANIENQNLLDATGSPTVSGSWVFSNEVFLKGVAPKLYFQDTDVAPVGWIMEPVSNDLNLYPISSPSAGDLVLDGPIELQPNYADRAFASDQLSLLRFEATYAHDGPNGLVTQNLIDLNPTVTQDIDAAVSTWTFSAINGRGTFTSTGKPLVATYMLFLGQPTMKSATASKPPVTPNIFWAAPACEQTANTTSMAGQLRSLYGNPTVKTSTAASANLTVPTVENVGLKGNTKATIAGSTLTVTNWAQVWIHDVVTQAAGTLSFNNLYGIVIDDLTAATNNYGIHSLVSSGANKWFLHHSGTAKSLLGGDLQINGNVGFYGTAATAKQTVSGSRGGNAALASLLTGLSNIGLITDSSSA